ncbi:MAG: transcriptional activator NhaR [Gammaproteobacteria bacterium]|nr:transcriptional activator NhaR [Gammaproteobacteria bacterium]
MTNLNLKHLRYFWAVASHGSIARASEILHLTPQTISGQLRELEQQFDTKLFKKAGRNLVLTDTGRSVFNYADEIFRLSNELQDVLAGRSPVAQQTLKVGIAMVVPKLLAYRILEPVLSLEEPVLLTCYEAPFVDLMADLSVHKLDIVLADSPLSPTLNIRAYNHLLGESGISFYARESEAKTYRDGFPQCLEGAPMLMPTNSSALRRSLELWFERIEVHPCMVAEFEDRALMKAFGEAAAGIFTTPTTVEADVLDKYSVTVIGRTDEVTERFFAISAERKIKHPAISAITEAARLDLFS